MKICKIISTNLNAIQKAAFANGIEWFGSNKRIYEKAVYVVVVRYSVAGKNRLFLLKGDSKERFNALTCVEVREDYFIQNINKLVEKYL